MGFKPREAMLKHQIDEGLKMSDYLNQSIAKIDNEVINKADITELDKYQPKGEYATTKDMALKLDKTEATSLYQPKGEYATTSDLHNYMPLSDMIGYVKQGDLAKNNDVINLDLAKKADKSDISKLQPKGDYVTSDENALKLDKTEATSLYQPKGDYATKTEVSIKANTSDLASYQKKGDYATKSELEGSIKLKAEKVHNHEVTDINGLDEKLSELKLEDTAIDVVSESKKLDIVLKELREKDTILTDKYATKEELEKAKLEVKDIDLSGYAKTVHTHDISAINSLDVEFQKYQLKETFEKNVIDLIHSEYSKHKIINGNKCVGIHHSDFLTILKYCKTVNIDNPTEVNLFYDKLESKPIFEEFLLNNPSYLFYDNGMEITEFNEIIDAESPHTLIYVDLDKLEVAGTIEALVIAKMIADENMNSRDLLIDAKINSIIRFLDEEFRDMGESINTITNELSSLI